MGISSLLSRGLHDSRETKSKQIKSCPDNVVLQSEKMKQTRILLKSIQFRSLTEIETNLTAIECVLSPTRMVVKSVTKKLAVIPCLFHCIVSAVCVH